VAASCLLVCSIAIGFAASVRAEDISAKPAPRTAIQIGDASVVLVAANDHLYAFVDRIDDNAPVADAELGVVSADGTTLEMHRATAGLFAAQFNHTGHMHDAFMVSLRSAVGTGEAQAQIAYDDLPDASGKSTATSFTTKLAIALASGGVGAIGALLLMLWVRGERRRAAARSVGTAQTV